MHLLQLLEKKTKRSKHCTFAKSHQSAWCAITVEPVVIVLVVLRDPKAH